MKQSLDFANFNNKELLIVVDSYSKWLGSFYMPSSSSFKTIEKLRTCSSAYGFPPALVSDGGPQLTPQEFNDSLKANRILHVAISPYHPGTNGLAERAFQFQTTKNSFLRRFLQDEKTNSKRSLQHRNDSFLFIYRNTPHAVTSCNTPAHYFKSFHLGFTFVY